MKKMTFMMLCIMAFATVTNAQNKVSDGTFETTAAGNFTLQTTTGTVNVAVARNIWGGVDYNGLTTPTMGVTTGGYTGNCGFFTVGSAAGSNATVYLYQRLSATAGLSTSKTYRLSFKAKSSTPRSGFFYIKLRGSLKFALRADWNYGASDTYGWCIYRNAIPTTWTEYSQTFVFSNSISGSPISSTQPPALASAVPFTDVELNDLIVGFYSNTTSAGTVYIDDVVFEEDTTTAVEKVIADNAKFVMVEGRNLKVLNPQDLAVYDSMGRIVVSVNDNTSNIALKNRGIYFVKAISKNGQNQVQKIIVK
jgi:hypothetical protein